MSLFSNSVIISKSVDEVYGFLEDLNNHQALMPQNIENWSSTKDEASFTIKNMINLKLKINERIPNTLISLVPVDKAPIEVDLKWELKSIDALQTEAKLVIHAELNMMLKMMASGPLQKLTDHQIKRLKEILG